MKGHSDFENPFVCLGIRFAYLIFHSATNFTEYLSERQVDDKEKYDRSYELFLIEDSFSRGQ